jgi:hypothetical protein
MYRGDGWWARVSRAEWAWWAERRRGAAAERGIWAVSGSSKVERRKAHAVEECRARVSSGPRRDGETVV